MRSLGAEVLALATWREHVCLVTDVVVNVQAEPADLQSWLALARRVESAGFGALLMGDHPGAGVSPWPALGSGASTSSDAVQLRPPPPLLVCPACGKHYELTDQGVVEVDS
jgi:hypothetical protein